MYVQGHSRSLKVITEKRTFIGKCITGTVCIYKTTTNGATSCSYLCITDVSE